MSDRLPTPTQRAAAVRPASLGRSSATAERVAARDAVAVDRAAILARLDTIANRLLVEHDALVACHRASDDIDALRVELRPQSAASRGGLAT